MSDVIVAHGKNFVPGDGNPFGPGFEISVTLDTRGAKVIYIFGWGIFSVGEPDDHWDDQGNTYFLMANPFSTCNGGMQGLRVFNPQTNASHRFSVKAGSSYGGTEIIVVAFLPTLSGNGYVNTRADSNCNPVKAGKDGPIIAPFNNALFVAAAHAGCGWFGEQQIDSDFNMIDRLPHLAVAYKTVPLVSTPVDPIWTTLGIIPDQPDPRGAAILEGFGIFNGDQPTSTGNTRIYEA